MVIFIITLIISFLGSVHPGPLNVSVVETTLKNSLKAGLIMAIGGAIPELFYSYLAAEGILFFERNQTLFAILRWTMVVILIVMGVLTIINKERTVKNKEIKATTFLKGFLLSLFNPQLLIFWLLIVVYYQGVSWLKLSTNYDKTAFVLGASIGSFLLNYTYANWAHAKKDYIFAHINKKIFRWLIGGSFILMALFQLFKMASMV